MSFNFADLIPDDLDIYYPSYAPKNQNNRLEIYMSGEYDCVKIRLTAGRSGHEAWVELNADQAKIIGEAILGALKNIKR